MSIPQLIGGILAGALVSSLSGKNQSSSGNYNMGAINYQPSASIPTVPKAPDTLEPGEDNEAAKAMEEAAEKERQAALARQQGGKDIFTSGLGVVGQANVNRKQLLGA